MPTLISINNYYYRRGGAETIFLEHNQLFDNSGWEVVPFAMQHSKNLPCEWAEYFVDEIEFGESYSAWEKFKRIPKVIYSFEARRKLERLIDRVAPDICHVHNIYHHISPSIFGLLAKKGIPTVLTLHDLKLACPAYKMLTHDGVCERCKNGKIYNVILHRCVKQSTVLSGLVMIESGVHKLLHTYSRNVDCFVVPSRFVLEKMIEWGWSRERFRHIPNFVDTAGVRPNYSAGDYFAYIGRLSHEKGVATLVQAAVEAGVSLQIAGTGPEEQALRELADRCGADVRFLGHLSGELLHNVVRYSRAVVLPSEWYENAPLSLMEAYALGKPVIAARIGGIPELIREEQTGVTYTPASVHELADVLRRFSSLGGARIEEMGHEGRSWMEAEYRPEHYRERILSLYRELTR